MSSHHLDGSSTKGMKEPIFTRHDQTVLPLLANTMKDTLHAIHTLFVNIAIDNMTDNIGLLTTQPTRGVAVTAVWQTLCKLCRPLPSPAMGVRLPFFWASRPCGPAGCLAMLHIKAGDVETNPGSTTTRKQVWICDICHRQIQVRKSISISCNRTEHWVHLRCAGIHLAQYTDTWACHQHR